VLRIRERCARIGDAPHGGRPRDDLAAGLRTVPFEKSAVIAYVVDGERVQITNIFYGGRDYEALYRGKAAGDQRS
jgi:toxin ParE1/3/4